MSVFLICGGFAIIAVMRVVQRVCSKTSSLLVADNYTFFKYGAAYQLFAALFALVMAFALVTAFAGGFYGVNAPTIVCSAISTILFGIEGYYTNELYAELNSFYLCEFVANGPHRAYNRPSKSIEDFVATILNF